MCVSILYFNVPTYINRYVTVYSYITLLYYYYCHYRDGSFIGYPENLLDFSTVVQFSKIQEINNIFRLYNASYFRFAEVCMVLL